MQPLYQSLLSPYSRGPDLIASYQICSPKVTGHLLLELTLPLLQHLMLLMALFILNFITPSNPDSRPLLRSVVLTFFADSIFLLSPAEFIV